MNKEQQELLDEVYENYSKKMMYHPVENWLDDGNGEKTYRQLSQQEFINKCKTDPEFSEKWGLTIEERELSEKERIILAGYDYENKGGIGWNMVKESVDLDNSIPRKLITITHNDKTIESYA
jgi:hypothetical protein